MVTEGTPAPDFTLKSDSGEGLSLASLQGKPVVLYFYPKDDTPGCTAQACGIRDAWDDFERPARSCWASARTAGPRTRSSRRSTTSRSHCSPTRTTRSRMRTASGARRSYAGKTYMGVERSTFVIGADGNVARAFHDVKPAEHADQVLEALPPPPPPGL